MFKRVLQQLGEDDALQATMAMRQGKVVDLDTTIALTAAKISVSLKRPMADSIILATGRLFQATTWTQDADFKGLDGVRYIAK